MNSNSDLIRVFCAKIESPPWHKNQVTEMFVIKFEDWPVRPEGLNKWHCPLCALKDCTFKPTVDYSKFVLTIWDNLFGNFRARTSSPEWTEEEMLFVLLDCKDAFAKFMGYNPRKKH